MLQTAFCNGQTDGEQIEILSKAQFKRRSFHEQNLIPLIKYMKRTALSIWNGTAVLLAWLGWKFPVCNAELFMCRT